MKKHHFLGLDISTQSLTAVIIEPSSGDFRRHNIHFDSNYPSYKTTDGVVFGDDPTEVHADPRMWIEALDDMLLWLKEKKISRFIRSIGVSAQQHGTVYLRQKASAILSQLDPTNRLHTQLEQIFSRETSPVWMDSSTNKECREITKFLGGDIEVARLTGSVSTERFAGPQIRSFWKRNPEAFENTSHIALISSFITALLIGRLAAVDAGDGFGTNLADIQTGNWSQTAMEATAPELKQRLPALLLRDKAVGNVSSYLVKRYGFDPETRVINGSGDNPCSLVGLGLIEVPEIHAISLGTSDTYFGYMKQILEMQRSSGHIFGTADGRYMFLICFKNGSLAREQLKEHYGLNWHDFSNIIQKTPSGNHGKIMLPYFLPEITPRVLNAGIQRFGGLEENDIMGNVRAVVEAQMMAMYLHSGWTGRRPKTIYVTAGGAQNQGLLKVISQVFGAEVYAFEVKESAALGAAIRAAHCYLNSKSSNISWKELTAYYVNLKSAEVIRPSKAEIEIYHHPNGFLSVYDACEKFYLRQGDNPSAKIEAFKQQFFK
ncbi:xylulokinase [Thermodesulfobacteriota bacterium]